MIYKENKMNRSILLIFAHPDDESFGPSGTTAKYRDLGIPTDLICATRGEVGSRLDVPEGVETAAAREAELRKAAAIIGIRAIYFLDFIDGQLDHVKPALINKKITKIMQKLQPEVVITFGPDGISGHPDHIAVGKAATAAFNSLQNKGMGPRKLYYITIPESVLPNAATMGLSTRPDKEVTTSIDITDYLDLKIQAIAAHTSQQDARDFSEMLGQSKSNAFIIKEYYYPVYPKNTIKETDLFSP
jgi:N-acetylglucosamine malate deacetylase 2